MFAPNEIVWRFEHEDDEDNRFCIRRLSDMPRLTAHRCNTVTDLIEDWADNEPGGWEDGDLLKVVVIWPTQLAGAYQCSMARRASAVVYDKTAEEA